MTPAALIEFEARVAAAWEAGKIRGPVHLSGGNEEALVDLFKQVSPNDWVFSTYRNHYHALLHGVDPDWLMGEILAGRSMNISHPGRRFFTSAIVAGCLPIAVGVAAAIKLRDEPRGVWVFVGDMAASIGAFHEAIQYAAGRELPIKFVVEDNGLSCDSPTEQAWGSTSMCSLGRYVVRYSYKRLWPHVGTGKFVKFSGF